MAEITIIFNREVRRYDLGDPARLTAFKQQFTRAINARNVARLRALHSQLAEAESTETELVASFIKRIHDSGLLPREELELRPLPLITDFRLLPRSEYYSRFQGTTAFQMDNPTYWSSYHRSQFTRFFQHQETNRRNATQHDTPFLVKPSNFSAFPAHTGGYHAPFDLAAYSSVLVQNTVASYNDDNVRDALLDYKCKMAQVVVDSFNRASGHSSQGQRIVYTENNYPCVLVSLSFNNVNEGHRKALQNLFLACFIAILNTEAVNAGIPIETVLRASFGHNLPSVCETNQTFRINVGLIPKRYAELMGRALKQLNDWRSNFAALLSSPAHFDDAFLKRVRGYNAAQLKRKIDKFNYLASLKTTPDYQEAAQSDQAFERLYNAFTRLNAARRTKGRAKFQPVRLKSLTLYQALLVAGDTSGKSVLMNCFRENGSVDWFADRIMDALQSNSPTPLADATHQLLSQLRYGETASMNYVKMHGDLRRTKRDFQDTSFTACCDQDPDFFDIVRRLCIAEYGQVPTSNLYAELERIGVRFNQLYRGSERMGEAQDYGSSSDFSDDLTDASDKQRQHHIAHKKMRLCAGMKAILVAQYGALSYLASQGVRAASQNVDQMYYEVENALRCVKKQNVTVNKIRAGLGNTVLHFDLNHCNASNSRNSESLVQLLQRTNPRVVILDFTSATSTQIIDAVRQCFSNAQVDLVMLANSGLKNDQGGSHEANTYGQLSVFSRSRRITLSVHDAIKTGLAGTNKLSQQTHEMVRANKNRGTAIRMRGIFNGRDRALTSYQDESAQTYYGK